ncbi:hypothetical protein BaOVIS_027090 [Babesia ovis]|uniref:Uncharacterized protein n=1 Tax=Babesia ovis TaxID=5869 RepID=A0A9W5WVQ2_BABOV|nr:hypothetical protein BaOVIS_027090 [Babesia ovis]
MSDNDETTDSDHTAKRHASYPRPVPYDVPISTDARSVESMPFPPSVWQQHGQQMSMMPTNVPMIPGFTPIMMAQNEEDARQLGVFQAAMMGAAQYAAYNGNTTSSTDQETDESDASSQSSSHRVLGAYPVQERDLREHILYETELYEDLREMMTERNHFISTMALLDRYFKGALSADARAKMAKLVQTAIDDRTTPVEESRRLKHILETLKNPDAQVHKPSKADETYLNQLADACKTFSEKYSNLLGNSEA